MKKFIDGIWMGCFVGLTLSLILGLISVLQTENSENLEINMQKYATFHFSDGDPAMSWSFVDITLTRQELFDVMKYYPAGDMQKVIKTLKLKKRGG